MLLSTKSFVVVGLSLSRLEWGVFVFYYFCVPTVGAPLLSTPTPEIHLWRTALRPLEHSATQT